MLDRLIVLAYQGYNNINAKSAFGRNTLWFDDGHFSSSTTDPGQLMLQRNGLRFEEGKRNEGTFELIGSTLLFFGALGFLTKKSNQESEKML